ncbi:hypothetical protein [Massilia sp. 9096]|uniref:hypothetical protein n=1 Tax=Massilia sp. 9096 TaxID=1500894 RepID=UPI000568112D|nr:hypothetical protein [Massilia sp. 9096]
MSDTPTQNGANRYDRVGRLIYGIQRFGGAEGLRGLKSDPGVAPDTAKRAAVLADRYDALMARFQLDIDAVGADEVQSLLRDAAGLFGESGAEG